MYSVRTCTEDSVVLITVSDSDSESVNENEELPSPEVITIDHAPENAVEEVPQFGDPLANDPLGMGKRLDFRVVNRDEQENETEVFVKSESDEWSTLTFHEHDLEDIDDTGKENYEGNSTPQRLRTNPRTVHKNPAPSDNKSLSLPTNSRTVDKNPAPSDNEFLSLPTNSRTVDKNPAPSDNESLSLPTNSRTVDKSPAPNDNNSLSLPTNSRTVDKNPAPNDNESLSVPTNSRTVDKKPAPNGNESPSHHIQHTTIETGNPGGSTGKEPPKNIGNDEETKQSINALKNVRFSRNRGETLTKIDSAQTNSPLSVNRTEQQLVPVDGINNTLVVAATRSKELETLAGELPSTASSVASESNAGNSGVQVPVMTSEITALLEKSMATMDSCNNDAEKIPPMRLRKITATGTWENASEHEGMLDSDIESVIGTTETLMLMKRTGLLQDVELQNSQQLSKQGQCHQQNAEAIVTGHKLNDKTIEIVKEKLSEVEHQHKVQEYEQRQDSENNKLVDGKIDSEKAVVTPGPFQLNPNESTQRPSLDSVECMDCHVTFRSRLSWRGHRPKCPVRLRKCAPHVKPRRLPEINTKVLRNRPKLRDKILELTKKVSSEGVEQAEELQAAERDKFADGRKGQKAVVIAEQLPLDPNKNSQCPSSQPFECADCHVSFGSRLSWRGHRPKCRIRIEKADVLTHTISNRIMNDIKSIQIKSTNVKNDFKAMKFSCNVCGKILSCKSTLDKHTAMHIKKMSFWCHMCGKGFDIRERLQSHLRLHIGSRPYKCKVCDRSFTTIKGMRVHQRKTRHLGVADVKTAANEQSDVGVCGFRCYICEQTFLSLENFTVHEAIHTKPPLDLGVLHNAIDSSSRGKVKQYSYVHSRKTNRPNLPFSSNTSDKNEETFSGQNSDKTFSNNVQSQEYFRLNTTGPPPYPCNSCEMVFRTADVLRHHHDRLHKRISFSCRLCNESFTTRFKLQKHMNTCSQANVQYFHNEQEEFPTFESLSSSVRQPFTCDICDRTFNGPQEVKLHTKLHRKEHEFVRDISMKIFDPRYSDKNEDRQPCFCDICRQLFATSDSWKAHILIHIKSLLQSNTANVLSETKDAMTFKCSICGTVLRTKPIYELHMLCHTRKPFKCEICDNTFSVRYRLEEHMLKHNNERPYQCEKCPKTYVSRDSFRKHKRIHEQGRSTIWKGRFKCDKCTSSFSLKSALTLHMRSHTISTKPAASLGLRRHNYVPKARRRYKCNICKKPFPSMNNLRRHQLWHSGEKPFTCELCDAAFREKHRLALHCREIHGIYKPAQSYRCELCPKTFVREGNLLRHRCEYALS